ncbi:MAG: hypothetical protein JRI44_03770 [Deltaproteobacteria bacterium]|nr:hypothetical protein [Deltaproteobacteria bacterium]
MLKKRDGFLILFLISLITSFLFVFTVNLFADENSECFKCHTSTKKLIQITRIIAKERPPTKSEETKGEG